MQALVIYNISSAGLNVNVNVNMLVLDSTGEPKDWEEGGGGGVSLGVPKGIAVSIVQGFYTLWGLFEQVFKRIN